MPRLTDWLSMHTDSSIFKQFKCGLNTVNQTGSGAHPASYPTGIVGSFPRGKTAWV